MSRHHVVAQLKVSVSDDSMRTNNTYVDLHAGAHRYRIADHRVLRCTRGTINEEPQSFERLTT